MVSITKIVSYLDELLHPELFSDYCPNGLQVSGQTEINKIVTGVTASQAFLDAAVTAGAQAVLVHHGFFWKGEDPCIVGIKQKRIATLINHGINLIAYHLPLDAHNVYGNNVQLASQLDIEIKGDIAKQNGLGLGRFGYFSKPMSSNELAMHIEQQLSRKPLHIVGKASQIKSIAWATGAAQDFIEEAAALGVDAFLTGEVSERTFHIARETGLHFFAAGHHATERYGVKSVGEHLSQKLAIEHQFIDINNPV